MLASPVVTPPKKPLPVLVWQLEQVFTVESIYRHFSQFHNRLAKFIWGEGKLITQQAQAPGQASARGVETGQSLGGYPPGHISCAPGAPMTTSAAIMLSAALNDLLKEHVHEIEWLKIASSR